VSRRHSYVIIGRHRMRQDDNDEVVREKMNDPSTANKHANPCRLVRTIQYCTLCCMAVPYRGTVLSAAVGSGSFWIPVA
jgi:hypothetical protein